MKTKIVQLGSVFIRADEIVAVWIDGPVVHANTRGGPGESYVADYRSDESARAAGDRIVKDWNDAISS